MDKNTHTNNPVHLIQQSVGWRGHQEKEKPLKRRKNCKLNPLSKSFLLIKQT